ncbi:unnamed protein product [Boreogadus saida]
MAEGGYEYTTVPEERFEEEDHKSIRSRSSKASSSYSSTQIAIKARAKAEAGRPNFAYVQREIELKVEKARLELEKVRLDATLEALQTEKEMDAALIEAEILESEALWQNDIGMDGRGRQRPLNDPHGNQGRTVNQSNPDTSTANDLASLAYCSLRLKEAKGLFQRTM